MKNGSKNIRENLSPENKQYYESLLNNHLNINNHEHSGGNISYEQCEKRLKKIRKKKLEAMKQLSKQFFSFKLSPT